MSTQRLYIEVRAAKIDSEVPEGDTWDQTETRIFHDISPQVTVTIDGIPRPLLEWQEMARQDELPSS